MFFSKKLYYLQFQNKNFYCKLINSDDEYLYLGLGRLGKYDYHIKDKDCKLSWGTNSNTIPYNDIKLLKDDKIIKIKKNIAVLKKVEPYLNVNDNVEISIITPIIKEHISRNENINMIFHYIKTNKKNKCNITDIDIWKPYGKDIIQGSYVLKHKNIIFNMHFRDIDTVFMIKKL